MTVLQSAIHELYDTELAQLLEMYRHLAFHAAGTQRAFYMAVAAHLNVEREARRSKWTALVASFIDDGEAGEIVE